jgi:ABC-2 type transport system ATP-binding protein
VHPGITGLLGANGAGKTTLFGMILGLHKPTGGELRVLGLDPIKAGPEIRGAVGYSPEYHVLPDDMRAHDLVRHICEVHGIPRREATARASDVLWQVGLGEERFRPVGTMSTGQRQRVKLAQAIVHDPALVLLDEPTDGLDPVQRDDMLALIRRVSAEFGINVILSSHLLEEVERICDAAVILFDGRVVASDRIDHLTRRTEALLVDVTDRADEVAAQARRRGADVEVEGLHLVVRPTDATTVAGLDLHDVIRDAVVDAGAGVRRMGARRVSLEEVFLDLGDGHQHAHAGVVPAPAEVAVAAGDGAS